VLWAKIIFDPHDDGGQEKMDLSKTTGEEGVTKTGTIRGSKLLAGKTAHLSDKNLGGGDEPPQSILREVRKGETGQGFETQTRTSEMTAKNSHPTTWGGVGNYIKSQGSGKESSAGGERDGAS